MKGLGQLAINEGIVQKPEGLQGNNKESLKSCS